MVTHNDSAIKKFVFRLPPIVSIIRFAKALKYRFCPHIFDKDFMSITKIDKATGFALDIGANNGQSASVIAHLKPGFSIVSFEPNPSCASTLKLLQFLLGSRLKVIHAGASNEIGSLCFFVPKRNGRLLLEEGSFEKQSFRDPETIERIGEEGKDFVLIEMHCQTVAIDDYDFFPDFIKIDVQGFELNVVIGMLETVSRSKPLIMIECGRNEEDIASLLEPLGYEKKYWNGQDLSEERKQNSVNYFMVPRILEN